MKKSYSSALVAITTAVLVVQTMSASRVDFNNPVRAAEDDLVKHFPDSSEPMNFKFYAG